jgi:membrane protease YdiL (CAAX protease family)
MNPITSFIKRHPQISFWGISCSTFYLAVLGYMLYPTDLWQLAIYFTFVGAVIVTAVADGRSGLRTFFSRFVRWRVNVIWYLIALLIPVIMQLAALGVNLALGGHITTPFGWNLLPALFPHFLYALLVISPGEEPGFRGFALPRLLIGRSALTASLILGALHVLWHLPLFVLGMDPPMTILIVMAGAIINTWIFNKTNGSILLNMVLHASIDVCYEIFNPMFSGPDAVRQALLLMAAYVVLGILLPILSGKELGRKSETGLDAMAAEQPALAG